MLTHQIPKKNFYANALKIASSILSISTAHYVGFIENLPPQVAILGGTAFAASVTSTFIFYATCCLVIARIFANGVVGGLLPADIFIERFFIEGKTDFQRRRKSLILYRNALDNIDKRVPILQFLAFLGFFSWSYLRPPIDVPSPAIVLYVAVALFCMLASIDLFLVWPHKYPKRLRKKWKSPQMTRINKRILIGGIVLLNIGAYVSGQARIKHILEMEPITIESENFTGNAQVIATVGDLYLLRIKDEKLMHLPTTEKFVYLDGKNVIMIPDSPMSVLPPIK